MNRTIFAFFFTVYSISVNAQDLDFTSDEYSVAKCMVENSEEFGFLESLKIVVQAGNDATEAGSEYSPSGEVLEAFEHLSLYLESIGPVECKSEFLMADEENMSQEGMLAAMGFIIDIKYK